VAQNRRNSAPQQVAPGSPEAFGSGAAARTQTEREGIVLKVAAFFLGLEVSPASAMQDGRERGEDREAMYC